MDKEPNLNNSELSNSEKYRQERKERIAKANQKRENETPTSKKNKTITAITIAAVAVICVVALLLNFFGYFTRLQTVVVTESGQKVSVAEYEYYYRSVLSYYHNTSMQYEQSYSQYYGKGAGKTMTGYDYTKTPKEQKYTLGDLDEKEYGKNPTWEDYFKFYATRSCYLNREIAKKAEKEKIKLSKDENKKINDYVEQLRKTAAQNNYALDAYLRDNYGKGMNEKLIRELLKVNLLMDKFTNEKSEEFSNSITDKVIDKEYNKDKSLYEVSDLRVFSLSSTAAQSGDKNKKSKQELDAETKKDTQKVIDNANAMLNSITDEASFKTLAQKYAPKEQKDNFKQDNATLQVSVTKAAIESNISKDTSKWVYSKDRKNGDKKMFEVKHDDGSVTCFVIYVVNSPYLDNTLQPVTIRHILIAFDDNLEDGKEVKVTQELKDKKKKLADEIYKKWKDGKATEETFADLAKTKSNDSGSAQNGGLIEDVKKGGGYVKPFVDWSIKDGRKVGDNGIIETDYGYHIMYCSKVPQNPIWKATIKTNLAQEKAKKYFDDLDKSIKKKSTIKTKKIDKLNSKMNEVAKKLIANTVKPEDTTVATTSKKEETTKKKSSKESTTKKK